MATSNTKGAPAPELPQNPFIDTDDSYGEAERLQTTVYGAVNVFAVLEKLLDDPPDGAEHISFGLEEYTGLQLIIAGAKAALNHVASEILEMEFQSSFAQLTTTKALRAKYPDLDGDQVIKMADTPLLEFFADALRVPELREIALAKDIDIVSIADFALKCVRRMEVGDE